MGHTCHTYRSQIWVRFSHSFWQWLLWWCECLCMGQWSTVCDSVRQIVTEQALTTCRAFCTEFDPELFSHRAYVKFFYDVCDKSAVFDILRPNETIFDMEMEREGGNREKMRKCREKTSLSISSFSLFIFFAIYLQFFWNIVAIFLQIFQKKFIIYQTLLQYFAHIFRHVTAVDNVTQYFVQHFAIFLKDSWNIFCSILDLFIKSNWFLGVWFCKCN